MPERCPRYLRREMRGQIKVGLEQIPKLRWLTDGVTKFLSEPIGGSMAMKEWYRRNSWSTRDQAEYFAKLKQARATSRPQYLRIQAHHLADAGLHRDALTLLDLYFQNYPGDLFATDGHLAQARSSIALGDEGSAIIAFRNTVAAERSRPNVGTDTWLVFPVFIVNRNLVALFDEAEQILNEFYSESKLVFPVQRFRYHFVRAFLADHAKNFHERGLHTTNAFTASKETHSGFRYHASEGLVNTIPVWQLEKLNAWSGTGGDQR